MKCLEHKLMDKEFRKMLRKQHNQNELTQYANFMKGHIEVGFYYKEARKYVLTLRYRR